MTRVDVVEDNAGFDALRDEWERLFAAGGPSVFQSFSWLRAWWRVFGEEGRALALRILVVRDARGAVIGLAPLAQERVRTFGVVDVVRLGFLGRPHSDYLDVLAAPGARAAVVEALADHLAATRKSYDVAWLDELSARGGTAGLLRDALARRGVGVEVFANERCPRVALARTWADTLASFSSSDRREIKRRRRNIEKEHDVALEIGGPSTAEEDLEEFIAMHQERWTGAGHTGALADDAVQRFHRLAVRDLAAEGLATFAFLRVDGHRVAALYCFRFRDELSVYLTGQRDAGDLRRFSLGRVLAGMAMERAAADGMKVYDFMRGGEPYKYELGGVDVDNETVIVPGARSALSGEMHRAALLSESLGRRLRHERALWRHAAGGSPPWAPASLRHARARAGVVWRDGMQKLRAPERSLSRHERDG